MMFSVIIPTKNRASLAEKAIASVLSQTEKSIELIVINDCSDQMENEKYAVIERDNPNVKFIHLSSPASVSFGKNKAINIAATYASGDYIAFLDDDDIWTDNDYLSETSKLLFHDNEIDVVVSMQSMSNENIATDLNGWINNIAQDVIQKREPFAYGFYSLKKEEMLASDSFCHMNTLLVKRELFDSINGITLDYTMFEDYDFYLRVVDAAKKIYLNPRIVSHHWIPIQKKQINLSTQHSIVKKHLILCNIGNAMYYYASSPSVMNHARLQKSYSLRSLTMIYIAEKKHSAAVRAAVEALVTRFSLKWMGYTMYVMAKSAFSRLIRR